MKIENPMFSRKVSVLKVSFKLEKYIYNIYSKDDILTYGDNLVVYPMRESRIINIPIALIKSG